MLEDVVDSRPKTSRTSGLVSQGNLIQQRMKAQTPTDNIITLVHVFGSNDVFINVLNEDNT
jgi:hypothetical protein